MRGKYTPFFLFWDLFLADFILHLDFCLFASFSSSLDSVTLSFEPCHKSLPPLWLWNSRPCSKERSLNSSLFSDYRTLLPPTPTTILRFFKGIAFHFLKIFLQSHELSSICFLAETPNCYLPYYCLYCYTLSSRCSRSFTGLRFLSSCMRNRNHLLSTKKPCPPSYFNVRFSFNTAQLTLSMLVLSWMLFSAYGVLILEVSVVDCFN